MKTRVIAEIGNSHEGSLGIALSFIEMMALTGVDLVKFQMHMGEYEGVPHESFRISFSQQDKNRQSYWERVSFSDREWKIISNYVSELGMEFLCTPFSVEAAKRLLELTDVKRWKIGSGDAVNFPLIDFLASTRLPLLISTGLISMEETLRLKQRLISAGCWENTTLMHCLSEYPTSLSRISLRQIDTLKHLGCKVGLSDHSGSTTPGLFAISKNLEFLEVHMTPHKKFFGPDVSSSLTPDEISSLVKFRNELEIIECGELSKEEIYRDSLETGKLFRKGIYWKDSFPPGHICSFEDLRFLKPVADMDSIEFETVIGRRLLTHVTTLEAVSLNQFEAEE